MDKRGGICGQVLEDGYQLHVPKGALKHNTQLMMGYTYTDPKDRHPPKGELFVSGVLHIEPERITRVPTERDVSIQLEHCIDRTRDGSNQHVGVVLAQEDGEYEPIDRIQVDGTSVIVWLKDLGSYYIGVVYTIAARWFVAYRGFLYREAELTNSLRFYFIVVKDLYTCIKVSTA